MSPFAVAKRCGYPQCREFVEARVKYCDAHKRERYQQTDTMRGGSDPFYKTALWLKARAVVMMEEPICRMCQKRETTMVDHVIPRKLGGSDLARDNLQGLCAHCHAIKTARDGSRSR